MWGEGTVILLPQKVDKEDNDKIIVWPDETTEKRNVLSKKLVTMMARHKISM